MSEEEKAAILFPDYEVEYSDPRWDFVDVIDLPGFAPMGLPDDNVPTQKRRIDFEEYAVPESAPLRAAVDHCGETVYINYRDSEHRRALLGGI